LGAQAHYDAISRGVLDSRDALYFVSAIAIFLGLTHRILNRYRYTWKKTMIVGSTFIGGLFLINTLGSFYFSRIDFTAEKRFTLSPLAKHTASNLEERVHITILLDGKL